jgi:hypothetical protein
LLFLSHEGKKLIPSGTTPLLLVQDDHRIDPIIGSILVAWRAGHKHA